MTIASSPQNNREERKRVKAPAAKGINMDVTKGRKKICAFCMKTYIFSEKDLFFLNCPGSVFKLTHRETPVLLKVSIEL